MQKHNKRLSEHLPEEGSIRCLEVTEKQFAGMKILLGRLRLQEKKVNANQMLLF
ncbi:CRISPR-associated endonuclease Cas2 [Pasteurella multocida]|nr:CRISPR-associated endonuclease Cas2 [Pasteurella multocida]PPE97097.1 CRISPR-associated endonuclease Cas2 [Pasteurella multocida]